MSSIDNLKNLLKNYISKEDLENIIDNVKTDLEVDIDNEYLEGNYFSSSIEDYQRAINWFYGVLKDKLNDYFEFERSENNGKN